jgi:hypothetical protein
MLTQFFVCFTLVINFSIALWYLFFFYKKKCII